MIHRLRRRSWVGVIGSLSLHALFAIGVWIFVGMSTPDEAPETGPRMVRLVAGDSDTAPAEPKSSRVVRRATTPRTVAKARASRTVTPTAAEAPTPPAPEERVTPEPPVPERESPIPPLATAAPDPVAGPEIAAMPTTEAAEPNAPAASASAVVADAGVEPGPEDGRAFAFDGPRHPDRAGARSSSSCSTTSSSPRTSPGCSASRGIGPGRPLKG